MSGQVAASWLANTKAYEHDSLQDCWTSKKKLDYLRDCWTQRLHRKSSVQSLHRKSSEDPTVSEWIIIPVQKIAGILIWLNRNRIQPRQSDRTRMTQWPKNAYKASKQIRRYSICFQLHTMDTLRRNNTQTSSPNDANGMEFACANYWFKTVQSRYHTSTILCETAEQARIN